MRKNLNKKLHQYQNLKMTVPGSRPKNKSKEKGATNGPFYKNSRYNRKSRYVISLTVQKLMQTAPFPRLEHATVKK